MTFIEALRRRQPRPDLTSINVMVSLPEREDRGGEEERTRGRALTMEEEEGGGGGLVRWGAAP
jgi:hypothetical protein